MGSKLHWHFWELLTISRLFQCSSHCVISIMWCNIWWFLFSRTWKRRKLKFIKSFCLWNHLDQAILILTLKSSVKIAIRYKYSWRHIFPFHGHGNSHLGLIIKLTHQETHAWNYCLKIKRDYEGEAGVVMCRNCTCTLAFKLPLYHNDVSTLHVR